jgi:hypothetical protein
MSIEYLINDYIRALSDESSDLIAKQNLIIEKVKRRKNGLFTYSECEDLIRESGEFEALIKEGDRKKILQVASLKLYITISKQ